MLENLIELSGQFPKGYRCFLGDVGVERLKIIPRGRYNGYVEIPNTHILVSDLTTNSQDDYYRLLDSIPVHGGIICSTKNDLTGTVLLGFDTAHNGGTLEKWTKERTIEETMCLLNELVNLQE